MLSPNIDSLFEFVTFTHEIRRIKRAMPNVGEDSYENDSEHGYQVALTSLYIIESLQLPLDTFRVMALAIVHDILEVHAGDTPVYGNEQALKSKADREAAALIKLKKQWPDLPLMHELIAEYEALSSQESKFVYALDKLLPMINNYQDNGRGWQREQVTFERLKSVKSGKITIDPTIKQYYEQMLTILLHKPELFSQSGTPEI